MNNDVFTPAERGRLRALLEAALFLSPQPIPLQHLARATRQPSEGIRELLDSLAAHFDHADHGLRIRTVAGGYQLGAKPDHHEELKLLLANLRPPLPLSKQAIETVAVVAMLQPVTAGEIQAARKVRNNDALRALLRRKTHRPGQLCPDPRQASPIPDNTAVSYRIRAQ